MVISNRKYLDGTDFGEALDRIMGNLNELSKAAEYRYVFAQSVGYERKSTMNSAHAQLAKMIQNQFMKVANVVPNTTEFNFIPLMTLLQAQFENDEAALTQAQRNSDVNNTLLAELDDAGNALQSAALVAWETVNGLKNRLDAASGMKSEDYPVENVKDFIYNNTDTDPSNRINSIKRISLTLEDAVTLAPPPQPPVAPS